MVIKRNANVFLVLVLLLSLFTGAFQANVYAAEIGNKSSVTVEGIDTTVLAETEVTYGENETALDVLTTAVNGDLDAELNPDWGLKTITRIKEQSIPENSTYYWGFFINGIAGQTNYDMYKVNKGDRLSFNLVDYTKPANTVSLKVVGENNTIIGESTYPVSFIGNPTALQLLQVFLGHDKVGFDEQGFLIIDGLQAEGYSYWAFYVDGEYASKPVNEYQLQPGNQITLTYETWEPTPTPQEPTEGEKSPTEGETVEPVSMSELQNAIDRVSEYVLSNQVGEWEAIALKQAGKKIPANYLENATNIIKEKNGTFRNITDYERYTLGILAAGGDPTNIGGYNLVSSIYNGDVTKQGLNGVAYALIALDSADFQISESATWTREKLVNYLVERQNQDNGWAWDGSVNSDPDTTAMVLTALAPYKNQDGVKEKVNAAVKYLSDSYLNGKINNSSTAAQIIIALSALAIDANSPAFINEESSLINYLFTFQNSDGGFDWQGGETSDVFTTSQGIQGLVAYQLFLNGKGSLYQLPLMLQDPVTEQPQTENTEVEVPKVETVPSENTQAINKETSSQTGSPLPNTATNMYNILAMGTLLILMGIVIYIMEKRKRV